MRQRASDNPDGDAFTPASSSSLRGTEDLNYIMLMTDFIQHQPVELYGTTSYSAKVPIRKPPTA